MRPEKTPADRYLAADRHLAMTRSVRMAQVVADVACVFVSFALGHATIAATSLSIDTRSVSFYLSVAAPAALLLLLVAENLGLYEAQASVLNIHEIRGVTRAVLSVTVIFLAFSFYFRDAEGHELSRLITTTSFGWLLILANAARVVIHKTQEEFYAQGVGCRRVLIYGSGNTGRHLLRRLTGSPQLGYWPVGFLDDRPGREGKSFLGQTDKEYTRVKVLGGSKDLERLVGEFQVDEVFVALPKARTATTRSIFEACAKAGVAFRFVPHLYGLLFQELDLDTLDGIPLMRRRVMVERPVYEAAKSLFDKAFALAAIVVTAPLWVLVMLLIRRDSPGPVFFVQERVGRGGVPFNIYKFRTMYTETPAYEFHPKSAQDPRLTGLGKWLRRLSIDELPQFVNVLQGHMSVVGPRPEMAFITEKYTAVQRLRLSVKPGITGLWQISADRSRMIHENMDYDLFYVHHRGLVMDLIIILETCFLVVRGVGAF